MVSIFQNPKWKQEYAIEINKGHVPLWVDEC